MSSTARVRVESRKKYNDPDRNFRDLFQEFKRCVNNSGIMHDYREHEFYQKKSEKERKKRREVEKRNLMDSLTNKILNGERVKASGGIIKKIFSNLNKDKKDKKKRNNYRNDN
jgi:ribosomal protein S21